MRAAAPRPTGPVGPLNIRLLEGPGLLAELGPALDDLHREVGAPIVARRPWLETWVASYRDHHPWAVVVEGPGGRLEAAALLATRRRRGISEIVRMGQGASDYGRLPARTPEGAAALADAVADRVEGIRGPWHLYLSQLPPGDPVAGALQERIRGAARTSRSVAAAVRFGPDRSLRAHVSRRHHRNSLNAINRLRKAGLNLTVEHFQTPAGIEPLLPEVDQVRRLRDQAAGRPNKLRDRRYASFRRAVILKLAERSELVVTTLRFDRELAAYTVALLDGASCRLWDGRFRPSLSYFYPGQLVIDAALEWALGDPRFTELDLMRGRLDYKERLATDLVPTEVLEAWSSPVPHVLFQWMDRLKKARAAAVRSAPPTRDGG